MNILIPMAGRGSRFAETGKYTLPKPLIDVAGRPMIVRVLENIGIDGKYIFIIRKDMEDQLVPVFKEHCNNYEIINVSEITQGAACTCLLAEQYINNEEHLLVANCDQLMKWDILDFVDKINSTDVDAYIFTFISNSPNNSYAKINRHGYVTRVAEKVVISNIATTGVYHWCKGKYMVESCKKMIEKNIRYNNEFYLCPSYNEMIEDGLIVKTIPVEKHFPLGTPEELEFYINGN
jgi:dTDP-glucose pyrophosphorylase